MYDPVAAFEKIRDNFLLYIKTVFGTKFPELEQERERRLRQPGVFYQEPWIEPLPRYERSGMTIHQLGFEDVPGLEETALEDFKKLASCGLVGDYKLYSHQVEMLRRALAGQNVVVTAGTGSGKTESFLLPLFAYLAKESKNWDAPGTEPDRLNDWWKNEDWQNKCNPVVKKNRSFKRSYRLPQRNHEKRDAAVRALILYPMNALVEDQLTRLRRALDSEAARKWFKNHRKGNRIYFGRYNGVTPVPGHEYTQKGKPNREKIEELVEAMQQMELSTTAAEKHAIETGDEDVRFFFPRLDGAEMRCRWDMQDAPPDILITNYCMLSIMLMRDVDQNIFEKTKEWLKKPDSVFHLIVDELHLYRGTAGTEVAYLLRLLSERLGLHPGHPKLRIIASSASLEPNDPKSIEFLKQFFGTEEWSAEQIIPGRPEQIPPVEGSDFLKSESFIALATAPEVNNLETLKETSLYKACRKILESESATVGARMFNACKVDGKIRAVSITDFAKGIFGDNLEDETLKLAARGLLIARGLCNQTSLPSFRLHWFFRNIEGLWACTKPNYDCHGHESSENRPVGRLFVENPPIRWGDYRVLELLHCEQCRTIFLSGNRLVLENNEGWELLPTEPDIEGIPDRQAARFLERRTYPEFAVFWPFRDIDEDVRSHWTQPSLIKTESGVKAWWDKASLDTRSGRIILGDLDPATSEAQWVKGYIFHLRQQPPEQQNHIGALPSVCPCCSANYSKRLYRKSPVRWFRTGFSKVSQLLSKELFYQLPEDEESRKLVVFSDSREDAASLSNGIERSHYDDLVREALFDELTQEAIAHPRLLEDIQNYGKPTRTEAIEFAQSNPNAVDQLKQKLQIVNSPLPKGLPPVQLQALQTLQEQAQTVLNEIQQRVTTRTVPLRILFEGDNQEPGLLMQRLKVLGVNPAGNDVDYQEFSYDGNWHHWTTLFDFSSDTAGWKTDLSPGAQERRENTLRKKVKTEVCDTVFSRLYFGIEASGLGYVRLNLPQEKVEYLAALCGTSSNLFAHICDGCLRIMGELYRYHKEPQEYPVIEWTNWGEARSKLCNYVKECVNQNKLSEQKLRQALWSAICQEGKHHHFILNPRYLSVRVAVSDDSVWECESCRRPHLHRAGGICTNTNCLAQLPKLPNKTCADLYDHNYYATEAVQKRQPLRLHCEELTGQTDDQAERQRYFRNIMVPINAEERNPNPEKITGDPPPVPFLSMSQVEIARRLLAKECLRRAFIEAGVNWWDSPIPPDSHGEFGKTEDWRNNETRRQQVRYWLEISPEVTEIVNSLLVGVENIDSDKFELFARNELFQQIDNCAKNLELAGDGLAERLAEGGILPMYGMPSRVRDLYHHDPTRRNKVATIDRDLDWAVTEFAPGSEKTKDKRIYTSIGFTSPLLPDKKNALIPASNEPVSQRKWMLRCSRCQHTETSDVRFENTVCPKCQATDEQGFRVFQWTVPLAFRTSLNPGSDAKDEYDVLIAGAGSVAESQPQDFDLVNGSNTRIAFSESGRVFRVNDNRGQLFMGATGSASFGRGEKLLPDQWIYDRYQNKPGGVKFKQQGATEALAIVAPKITGVLRIRPATVPSGLCLDPIAPGSAVKAAFYSAAFIVRSVVAEELDIDPEELDVSGLRQFELENGEKVGELVISDRLPNGSGFTYWLANHWQEILLGIVNADPHSNTFAGSLISPQHRHHCDSSCYDCLRQYRNMNYHGLLDWRLGLAVLRVLANNNFPCGLDGDFSSPDLENWLNRATDLRDTFCASFNCSPQEFGTLPGFDVGDKRVVIVHPLWNRQNPIGLLADAIATLEADTQIQYLDTFNLLRRPSWCYQSLEG